MREGLGIAAEAALSEEHHRATFDRLQSPWSSPTSLNLLTITAASRVRVRRNDRAISVVLPPSRKPVMTVTGVRAGLGHRLGILTQGKREHTIRSAYLRDPRLFQSRGKVKSEYSMHALAV